MNLDSERTIVPETIDERVVAPWVKAKGFDLSCTIISVPVFKIHLNVAFGPYDEFRKLLFSYYKQDIAKHAKANAMVCTFEHEGVRWNWMNIQSCEWTGQDYGTLSHELHHVTHFAMSDMGCTYGPGGEEAYAYLHGYLMELVCRAFVMYRKAIAAETPPSA